jgi:hypothetical protein
MEKAFAFIRRFLLKGIKTDYSYTYHKGWQADFSTDLIEREPV